MVFEKAVSKHFKNNRRVFSAWNRQNNTNIKPGPENQHSEMVRSIFLTSNWNSQLRNFGLNGKCLLTKLQ